MPLEIRISDFIKQLKEYKRKHGDLPVLSTFYIKNDDGDSPNEGEFVLSEPLLSEAVYVEHYKEDGTVAYSYLKSTNPHWRHGSNKEQKVLLIGTGSEDEQ